VDDSSSHVFEDMKECFITSESGKIIIGEIVDLEKPDFHELYQELKKRANNTFWDRKNE
jgi:hypothetical protein